MEQIKTYEKLLSKPDQHIALLKESSEKLDKAEKWLLDSDAKKKKLEAQVEQQQIYADAEKKKLVLEKAEES